MAGSEQVCAAHGLPENAQLHNEKEQLELWLIKAHDQMAFLSEQL